MKAAHIFEQLNLAVAIKFIAYSLLHRLDSLVQSQAKELSQLRQQIKESRRLGALQRRQLEEVNKAFKDLVHASEVDDSMGEVIKEKLDKSLSLLDKLEGRLDKGFAQLFYFYFYSILQKAKMLNASPLIRTFIFTLSLYLTHFWT